MIKSERFKKITEKYGEPGELSGTEDQYGNLHFEYYSEKFVMMKNGDVLDEDECDGIKW